MKTLLKDSEGDVAPEFGVKRSSVSCLTGGLLESFVLFFAVVLVPDGLRGDTLTLDGAAFRGEGFGLGGSGSEGNSSRRLVRGIDEAV